MTYLALDVIFLALAGAAGLVAVFVHRGRRGAGGARLLPAIGITMAVTLLLTAVFDNLMIAAGLFWYEEDRLLRAYVGLVPVEDFAYPIAAAILLPSLWILIGRRSTTDD
ncbi:MAG TPA: lycopene cyclase domain-containing protein [Glaciibacter sp.]|nr:lycopene cyclase domain-containing protein [Glaciibacter sp.]